jgi:hypothetical protein
MKSQADRILQYIKSGKREITDLRALNLFDCRRLSARIYDLRKLGYIIYTRYIEKNNKRYAAYRMDA